MHHRLVVLGGPVRLLEEAPDEVEEIDGALPALAVVHQCERIARTRLIERLAGGFVASEHADVWRRGGESSLDDEMVRGIIFLLMQIDAHVRRILREFAEEDDDGELEP